MCSWLRLFWVLCGVRWYLLNFWWVANLFALIGWLYCVIAVDLLCSGFRLNCLFVCLWLLVCLMALLWCIVIWLFAVGKLRCLSVLLCCFIRGVVVFWVCLFGLIVFAFTLGFVVYCWCCLIGTLVLLLGLLWVCFCLIVVMILVDCGFWYFGFDDFGLLILEFGLGLILFIWIGGGFAGWWLFYIVFGFECLVWLV